MLVGSLSNFEFFIAFINLEILTGHKKKVGNVSECSEGKSSERNSRECPNPICRSLNAKKKSKFEGSAQSQEEVVSCARMPPLWQ